MSSAVAILTNCRLAIRFRFAPASEMSAVLRKVLCGAAIGPISKSAAEAGRVVVTATSVSAPASAPLSRRFDLIMILAITGHLSHKDISGTRTPVMGSCGTVTRFRHPANNLFA
jgi:hypothetical protein